jgi:hypothetical protein
VEDVLDIGPEGIPLKDMPVEEAVVRRDMVALSMLTIGAVAVQVGIICWVLAEAVAATVLVSSGFGVICIGSIFLTRRTR